MRMSVPCNCLSTCCRQSSTVLNGCSGCASRSKLKSDGPQVKQSTPGLASWRAQGVAGVGAGGERFDLETENAGSFPPRRILLTVVAAFDAIPSIPAPAPFARLGVVESRQRLIDDGVGLDQGHLNAQGAEIEDVANEIGMARMLDAELHGDPDLLSHGAKRHQQLFVVRGMLAIHRHKTVRVSTQDVF